LGKKGRGAGYCWSGGGEEKGRFAIFDNGRKKRKSPGRALGFEGGGVGEIIPFVSGGVEGWRKGPVP